ncbi:hypothetical protein BST61_g7900 [Cercospora zeina]
MQRDQDDSSSPFVGPFAWDDDDWKLWNAMVASRDSAPTVAPPEEAAIGGSFYITTVLHANASTPLPTAHALPVTVNSAQTVALPATIVCKDIASIPPGRQHAALLQCGICMHPHLWSRKADLKRHMETHQPGTHFCHVNGCRRGPGNGFTRVDKLHEHLKKIHGL